MLPMTRLSRRRFLVAGAAGAAALALAGGYAWMRRRGAAATASALDPAALAIVGAIVPAMLAGALPAVPADRARAVAETVAGVDRAIAGLAPSAQGELGQLFSLLSIGVGRRAIAGVASPWDEAPLAEVEAFLVDWRDSAWSLKRTAYDALHQLIFAAWYANPRSWPAIGYPGPPMLGA